MIAEVAIAGRQDSLSAAGEQLRLVRHQSLADARDAWEPLAAKTGNIFSTWEWADAWCRHLRPAVDIRLAVVQAAEREAAVLPMHLERRGGLRVLRFLGHGLADQLGPVCADGDIPLAVAGLNRLMSDGSMLLAERMPADAELIRRLTARALLAESSPVIDLSAERDWDTYLGARSSNFRQQVRRRERKLRRRLDVSFRLTDDPDRLQEDFDTLIALHAARWGAGSSAFDGPREPFHRDFAARALERGWLRLWIAEAAGRPVAAWYGFRFAGVESYYQSGRDPDWDRHAVGAGILEHSIRTAFEDGMREYRLLRGGEQYKGRYASSDVGLRTVVAARRRTGRAAVSAIALLARSERGRRLLKASEGR